MLWMLDPNSAEALLERADSTELSAAMCPEAEEESPLHPQWMGKQGGPVQSPLSCLPRTLQPCTGLPISPAVRGECELRGWLLLWA
jgi:hypothetical protein